MDLKTAKTLAEELGGDTVTSHHYASLQKASTDSAKIKNDKGEDHPDYIDHVKAVLDPARKTWQDHVLGKAKQDAKSIDLQNKVAEIQATSSAKEADAKTGLLQKVNDQGNVNHAIKAIGALNPAPQGDIGNAKDVAKKEKIK